MFSGLLGKLHVELAYSAAVMVYSNKYSTKPRILRCRIINRAMFSI